MTGPRLLVVDDHVLVRSGLRLLLESEPGWEVVGEAGAVEPAIALARDLAPDVTLLDLHLADEDATEAIPAILAACPTMHLLILTADRESASHERAIALGAAGLVLKDDASSVLIEAVQAVARGEAWLDRRLTARVLARLRSGADTSSVDGVAAKVKLLTRRERDVIALVCEGLQNQDVASRLFISEATVRHHLTSIFAKLRLSGRFELIVFANRHGLAKSGG